MNRWIKENKISLIIIVALIVALGFVYFGKQSNQPVDTTLNENEVIPKVGGIDWNKPFEKNLSMENIYKNSKNLPSNHTLCIPVKKFLCDANECQEVEPKVFNLIGGSSSNPTISRCDSLGCDTYEAIIDSSGEYKNIQSIEPRGFIFKMSYNTLDKKFIEVTTLGLDTYVTYGYCMYDFEYKK